MAFYHPHPDQPGKEVKIDPNYQLGGFSYLTGKNQGRGLYVNFTTVERGNSAGGFKTESFQPFASNSFKVLALPMQRASKKKLALLHKYVHKHQAELAAAYLINDKPKIADILNKFAEAA